MIGGLDETYISLGGVLRGGGVKFRTRGGAKFCVNLFINFAYIYL